MKQWLLSLVVLAAMLSGCTSDTFEDDPSTTPAWLEPVSVADGCFDADDAAMDHDHPVVTFETNFGTIEAEIYEDYVPITARAFLDRVETGYYDGLPFHRIITDFMMQGGDGSNDPDGAKNTDSIPDEFHHRLRHDEAGLLSMANAGPNTGSDQFFITFAPTPHLDDWHTVFGKVTSGYDVMDAINADASTSGGTPSTPVTLESATISHDGTPGGGSDFGLLSPDSVQKVSTRGGETAFLVLVENCQDDLAQLSATVSATGADVRVEEGFENFELPGAQRKVFAIYADAESGSSDIDITLTVTSGSQEHSIDLSVQRAADTGKAVVHDGQQVEAHYIGMTLDGRLFDTSYASVADDDRIAKFDKTWSERARGDPFTFTPGAGVIPGFTKLAIDTQEGSTNAGSFEPKDGYGESFPAGQNIFSGHPLTGKPLFFQLEVLDILA